MNKRQALGWGLTVLGALGASLMTACAPAKTEFKSVDITGAEYARDFKLPDQNGRLRTLADFKGKVVVVFFGYTQCPDVCPTTMSELAEVKRQLGADGERLQAIFVTVDPARDTAEMLQAYMGNFDPSSSRCARNAEQLAAVAKDFKIYYKKVEGKTESSYTMDHFGRQLHLRHPGPAAPVCALWPGPQALLSDLQALLRDS
jgi:protein SCO1/2